MPTRWNRLTEAPDITLGALASGAVAIAAGPTMAARGSLVRAEHILGSMTGLTAGEGPVFLGLADGQLSAAEIADVLTTGTATPSFPDEKPETEVANRKVRVIACFARNGPSSNVASGGGPMAPSNGELLLTDFDWKHGFTDDRSWVWFVANFDSGALTTGGVLHLHARWLFTWSE